VPGFILAPHPRTNASVEELGVVPGSILAPHPIKVGKRQKGWIAVDRKELLTKVRDEAGLQDLKQADNAVRVIVGVLKAMLPGDVAMKGEGSLPDDLRQGWRMVEP
jgi:TPP-dependent trihydroxycyclohexane-1,2-dione (THcHDO) dehydratase